jgi:hypothetical protein
MVRRSFGLGGWTVLGLAVDLRAEGVGRRGVGEAVEVEVAAGGRVEPVAVGSGDRDVALEVPEAGGG